MVVILVKIKTSGALVPAVPLYALLRVRSHRV